MQVLFQRSNLLKALEGKNKKAGKLAFLFAALNPLLKKQMAQIQRSLARKKE